MAHYISDKGKRLSDTNMPEPFRAAFL